MTSRILRPFAALLLGFGALATLAGCGSTAGAGGIGTLPAVTRQTVAPALHRGKARVMLRFLVPKKRRVGHGAHFISPSTKGMTIALTGPAGFASNQTVGLTPASPGCTGGPSGSTCQITVGGLTPCPAVGNCYLATLVAYDAVSCTSTCTIPVSAQKLSAAQGVAFRVSTGAANVLSVTLGGIARSVSVSPIRAGYLQGDAHKLSLWGAAQQSLSIEALDADGNPIVGPGSPSIAVSSSTGALAVSGPATGSPNVVALAAVTSGSPAAVTPGTFALDVTVTPSAQSGGSTLSAKIPVVLAHSAVYLGGSGLVQVYYDGNTSVPNVAITGSNTGFSTGLSNLEVDGRGTLYVTTGGAPGTILEFPAGASGNATPTLTIAGAGTGLDLPTGIAVDSTGSVYAANFLANSVTEYAAGTNGDAPATETIAGSSTLLNDPAGIALEGSGTIYVVNRSNATITEYAAGSNGDVLTASISGPATNLSSPGYPAVFYDGTICAFSTVNALPAILEYAAGSTGNAAPIRTISGAATGLAGVSRLFTDAGGNVYSVNDFTVTEYPESAGGNAAPTATYAFGGIVDSGAVIPAAFAP
jgi:hypothetical protein